MVGLAGPDGIPVFWLGLPPVPRPGNCTWPSGRPTGARWTRCTRPPWAAGAEVLHAPREWPEYHPGYYGVFLRDPDRHNVEAVDHG